MTNLGGRVLRVATGLWLPLAVAVTGLAALTYGAVQQDLRLGADEPQIALAQDAAGRLDAGAVPADAVGPARVEIASSLDPFVMVFDDGGRLLASGATSHGAAPDFPPRVFDSVRARGEDRLTWQPEPGVRIAAVCTRYHAGFVVAGRSLRTTEDSIAHIGALAALVWILTLAATAVAAQVAARLIVASP